MGIKEELTKSVDQIAEEILRDWRGQDPGATTGIGSDIHMDATAYAAAKWGILQGIKWVARQMFADTADEEYLERHAAMRDIVRETGEKASSLLDRYFDDIRNPEGSGSAGDHVKWSKSIINVKAAYCKNISSTLGTVQIIVVADASATGSEAASNHTDVIGTATSISADKLVDSAAQFQTKVVRPGDVVVNNVTDKTAVVVTVDSETQLSLDTDIFTLVAEAYTVKSLCTQAKDYVRLKVTPNLHPDNLDVIPPIIQPEDVTMTITGSALGLTLIKSDIVAYMNTLKPGESLIRNQLRAIAIKRGATDLNLTEPAANVAPGSTTMIRPGVVDVSAA